MDAETRSIKIHTQADFESMHKAGRLAADTLDYIVDDTPEKIGKFSPGTGIPIVDRSTLMESPPDYLVILAWNFAREIIDSVADFHRGGGKFIIPVPKFEIVA